ncbi:MAG: lipoyl(octanoyl) transferase LipB [Gammaproteobacteria bacterium]|nr:lipoyl(octanoyl) transferase LipB [Gammaproteobacteria bacterium]
MRLRVRRLGRVDYHRCWAAMREFSAERGVATDDELWVVEHDPVFTQGRGGKPEHVLAPGDIPVVPTDRGGQVTYHGPGQVVVYLLLDLNRLGLGPRELVRRVEQGVLDCLATLGIGAERRAGAPGVYVGAAKVASLGLRIRNGMSYHGVALNVDLELEPFSRINPCGYAGLAVTRLADLGVAVSCDAAAEALVAALARALHGGIAPEVLQGEPCLPPIAAET